MYAAYKQLLSAGPSPTDALPALVALNASFDGGAQEKRDGMNETWKDKDTVIAAAARFGELAAAGPSDDERSALLRSIWYSTRFCGMYPPPDLLANLAKAALAAWKGSASPTQDAALAAPALANAMQIDRKKGRPQNAATVAVLAEQQATVAAIASAVLTAGDSVKDSAKDLAVQILPGKAYEASWDEALVPALVAFMRSGAAGSKTEKALKNQRQDAFGSAYNRAHREYTRVKCEKEWAEARALAPELRARKWPFEDLLGAPEDFEPVPEDERKGREWSDLPSKEALEKDRESVRTIENWGHEQIYALAETLSAAEKLPALEAVAFKSTSVDDRSLCTLLAALQRASKLTTFQVYDLVGCAQIGDLGLLATAHTLLSKDKPGKPLEQLSVTGANITDGGMTVFCELLLANNTLRRLDVRNVGDLSMASWFTLLDAIEKHSSITEFEVDDRHAVGPHSERYVADGDIDRYEARVKEVTAACKDKK